MVVFVEVRSDRPALHDRLSAAIIPRACFFSRVGALAAGSFHVPWWILKETAGLVKLTISRPKTICRVQGRRSVLKSIDPILNADVLYALRAMGHGDDLVICDTNFPADAVARQTVLGRLLRIDNVTAGRAARAILSVLPLDSFVDNPALRMQITGKPDEVPPVQVEVQSEIDAAQGLPLSMGSIERFAFYELAKKSYCVIQTGERRFYGCFVFKKGVIAPDAA